MFRTGKRPLRRKRSRVGIDLTRRDLQLAAREFGRPWDWGKSFVRSAPCAALRRVADVGHPTAGRIWLQVNGIVKQEADLGELIWPVPEIIAHASRSMALAPGDLIYTGTPAGVGPVERGVDGVGEMEIRIV